MGGERGTARGQADAPFGDGGLGVEGEDVYWRRCRTAPGSGGDTRDVEKNLVPSGIMVRALHGGDGQLGRADWPPKQIALHQVATVRPQSGELVVRLHTFGGHP